MQRTVSMLIAAAMALGTITTFTPATAVPLRVSPEAAQPTAGNVEKVHDRRSWRRHGRYQWRDHDRRDDRRHYRNRRHHKQYVVPRQFFYGFPFFAPPRHDDFRRGWHGRRDWRGHRRD